MGKALIINGTDFSAVAVGQITMEYNPVGEVDLSQYEKLHMAVESSTLKVYENLSTCDAYIVPVIAGETYSIKFCAGRDSCVVLGLDDDVLETRTEGNDKYVSNYTSRIVSTDNSAYDFHGTEEFVIPNNGCNAIFICGRNNTHTHYESGYELTLTKLS